VEKKKKIAQRTHKIEQIVLKITILHFKCKIKIARIPAQDDESSDPEGKKGPMSSDLIGVVLFNSEIKAFAKVIVVKYRSVWDNHKKNRHVHSLLNNSKNHCQMHGELTIAK
jgi:hypothetical protein